MGDRRTDARAHSGDDGDARRGTPLGVVCANAGRAWPCWARLYSMRPVLKMPPSCWSGNALDEAQRHSRYSEAADGQWLGEGSDDDHGWEPLGSDDR